MKIVVRKWEEFIGFICAALAIAATEATLKARDELIASRATLEALLDFLPVARTRLTAAQKQMAAELKRFKYLLGQAVFVGVDVCDITVKPPTYSTLDKIDLGVRCNELVVWLQHGGEVGRGYARRLQEQAARVAAAKELISSSNQTVKVTIRDIGGAKTNMFALARHCELLLQMSSPEGVLALREMRRKQSERNRAANDSKPAEQPKTAVTPVPPAANGDREDTKDLPPPTPLAQPA